MIPHCSSDTGLRRCRFEPCARRHTDANCRPHAARPRTPQLTRACCVCLAHTAMDGGGSPSKDASAKGGPGDSLGKLEAATVDVVLVKACRRCGAHFADVVSSSRPAFKGRQAFCNKTCRDALGELLQLPSTSPPVGGKPVFKAVRRKLRDFVSVARPSDSRWRWRHGTVVCVLQSAWGLRRMPHPCLRFTPPPLPQPLPRRRTR